jgi:uncharacterized protein YndB with AHSA1/START domain
MTALKDFKRLVRTRMQKTGESYTAARAHLVAQRRSAPVAEPVVVEPATAKPIDYAALAGMSDDVIKAKTGCTWEKWVYALDRKDASTWTHREIADYVQKTYKVPDWWTQTVTVGYERIKGLRAIGQRRNGSFEANKSKTFAAPVSRVYKAFHDARVRAQWLPDVKLTVRKATRDKSMRITWPDGSSVEALFYGKGAGKSQLAISHRKLKAQAASAELKAFWTERLAALADVVAG